MKNICKKYGIDEKSWELFGKMICMSTRQSENENANKCLDALKDLILHGDIPSNELLEKTKK